MLIILELAFLVRAQINAKPLAHLLAEYLTAVQRKKTQFVV